MARAGTYVIHTQEPGKPDATYLFYTVAQSEAQALKNFRIAHKRWRVTGIQSPLFPAETSPNEGRPRKPKGRKRQ